MLHLENIESIIESIYKEIEGVWGNKVVLVYDMKVVGGESIEIGEELLSNVWLRVKVKTEEELEGTHLIKVPVRHDVDVTVEKYVELVYMALNNKGRSAVSFYNMKNGRVIEISDPRGRGGVTFSIVPFKNYIEYVGMVYETMSKK